MALRNRSTSNWSGGGSTGGSTGGSAATGGDGRDGGSFLSSVASGILTLGESVKASTDYASTDSPGLTTFEFGGSGTDNTMYRVLPAATPTGLQIGVTMPYRGSVIALSVNAASTPTTAVLTVYINGVAQSATLSWSSGNEAYALFPQSVAAFSPGQIVSVRWTGTIPASVATVFCSLNPQTVL